MLGKVMEADVIRGLGPMADSYTHAKAVAYFEEVKSCNHGLELCATCLAEGTYQEDHVNFFLWQVLEHQIKFRHAELPQNLRDGLRATLLLWLQNYSKQATRNLPSFLRNKAAQVFALVFSHEYLSQWTTFIHDTMYTALGENPFGESVSEKGRDMYLRVLLAIDSEVVDRTIDHTTEEQTHNQLLKDTMRQRCVTQMVDSWYAILVNYKTSECIATCLQVVGAYITWIDINLIANHRYMELIYGYLGNSYPLATREAACDCLREIALKGMLPLDKLALIETLWGALLGTEVLVISKDDAEIDFVIKLSRLVGSMASALVVAWNKVIKVSPSNGNNEASMMLDAINTKLPMCIKFFGHEDDDVSAQCVDFLRDYIDMQKKIQQVSYREELFTQLFLVVAKKLQYDEDYNFENEGEEEVEFQEFLKSLKILFDNLALLAPQIAAQSVQALLFDTLSRWQTAPFHDVEVAIRLVYMLGETLPSNLSAHFSVENNKSSPLHEMMTKLITSDVSSHPHSAVRLQFFETVVRYDRYFPVAVGEGDQARVVARTTQAFLDQRGLRSGCPKVRSRCAYLFSRFVKTLGKQLTPFGEEILNQIQDLVILNPTGSSADRALSPDDQLFIYELAGHVVVNSTFTPDKKATLMTALLRPLVEQFRPLLVRMKELAAAEEQLSASQRQQEDEPSGSGLVAKTLNYAMSYASRTSKAFSNKHTMSQSGCANVYTGALEVFLTSLDTNVHKQLLHTGVRQYLHRMVICMEDEVLPFVPITVRHLLSNDQSRSLHDFIPLLNQIVNKFKKLIEPFLQEVFMLVVRAVFELLSRHNGTNNGEAAVVTGDDDAKMIRRSYFQFLFALVSNDVAKVILGQAPADTEMVLSTIVQGAGEFPDPISQKICFGVLVKLIEAWESAATKDVSMWDFATKSLIPVCFMAPMKATFDLADAQTVLALNESAYLLKALHVKQGCNLESHLRDVYLPSLNTSQSVADEFCRALHEMNSRDFRTYLKMFFKRAKT